MNESKKVKRTSGSLQPAATAGGSLEPAATLSLSQALAAYLQRRDVERALSAQTPAERRQQLAAATYDERTSRIIKGYWLAEIQEAEGRDAMIAAAAEMATSVRAADYATAQFRLFNALEDVDAVERLSTLPSHALHELRFTREEWIEFAGGAQVHEITLDHAREMQREEIRAHERNWQLKDKRIAELEGTLKETKLKLSTANAKLKTADDAAQKPGLTKVDAIRREVRVAGSGYGELIQQTAAALFRLTDDMVQPLLLPDDENDALIDKAVCTGLLAEAEAAKAAVDEAVALIRARLDGRLARKAGDVPVMTAQEAQDARDRRAAMSKFTQKEKEAAEALAYLRNELDGLAGRGAPPAAVKKIRRKAD